jgi:hypothetical protein
MVNSAKTFSRLSLIVGDDGDAATKVARSPVPDDETSAEGEAQPTGTIENGQDHANMTPRLAGNPNLRLQRHATEIDEAARHRTRTRNFIDGDAASAPPLGCATQIERRFDVDRQGAPRPRCRRTLDTRRAQAALGARRRSNEDNQGEKAAVHAPGLTAWLSIVR